MTIDMPSIRWGVLGLGRIARTFATQLPASTSGRLVSVASRDADREAAFAHDFGVKASGGPEGLLADPDVDAVYVATEHTAHVEWSVHALESGKHVLVEKPIAVNEAGAALAVEAARRTDRVLVEAYMYRLHPQILKLLEVIREGELGTVHHIASSFGYRWGAPDRRIFDAAQAGGGILELGGYPVSIARTLATASSGESHEPAIRRAGGQVVDGIDQWAGALLEFPSGLTAHVSAATGVTTRNDVQVFGSRGHARVPEPWLAPAEAPAVLQVATVDGGQREYEFEPLPIYALEADHVADRIRRRPDPEPAFAELLGQARCLDSWRAAIGLRYPFEQQA